MNSKSFFGVFGIHLMSAMKVDENDLKEGFRLVPNKFKAYKDDYSEYSHLYKDGKKVSNKNFRRGGLCSGFKDGYCMLLEYTKNKSGRFGTHCLVDLKGKVVFRQTKMFSPIYHLGGVIVVEDSIYYNLKDGKPIVKGSSSVRSEKFLFVENNYEKEYELGVHKIEYATGKTQIFK